MLPGSFAKTLERLTEVDLAKNSFVIVSLIGQEFLSLGHQDVAVTLLKISLEMDSPSLMLKQSTLGALAHAYYLAGNCRKALDYMELQLAIAIQLSEQRSCETSLQEILFLEDVALQTSIHGDIAEVSATQGELQLAIIHRRSHLRLLEQVGLAY